MAGITLAQAQAQLDAWLAASLKIAQSQSYTIQTADGAVRTLSRANAQYVTQQIDYWRTKVEALTPVSAENRHGRRTRQIAPG